MIKAVDRRAFIRLTPESADTCVEIMDWTGTRITRATLLNVSRGGALVCSYTLIATSQKMRVRLVNAPELDWTDAEVVHLGLPQQVGIRFQSLRHSEFVLAATKRPARRPSADDREETPLVGQWLSGTTGIPNEPPFGATPNC